MDQWHAKKLSAGYEEPLEILVEAPSYGLYEEEDRNRRVLNEQDLSK